MLVDKFTQNQYFKPLVPSFFIARFDSTHHDELSLCNHYWNNC